MRESATMSFTMFDKEPVLRAIEDFGGVEGLPYVQALPDTGCRVGAVDAIERFLNEGYDFYTVWEVDDFCCTYLHTHPALVYGEMWWEATAPSFDSINERDAYILQELSEGRTVTRIAGQLGLSLKTVSSAEARVVARRSVPLIRTTARAGAKYSLDTIRAIKCDLAAGVPRRDITDYYGIPKSTLAKIAQGRLWAWTDVASAA